MWHEILVCVEKKHSEGEKRQRLVSLSRPFSTSLCFFPFFTLLLDKLEGKKREGAQVLVAHPPALHWVSPRQPAPVSCPEANNSDNTMLGALKAVLSRQLRGRVGIEGDKTTASVNGE